MTLGRVKTLAFRTVSIGVWVLAIFVLIVAAFNKFTPYKLILNHTSSMPVGFYVLHTGVQPTSVNQIVVVRYQAPPWALRQQITGGRGYFIKRVGALPGSFIQKVGAHIYRCPVAHAANPTMACTLIGVRKPQGFDGYHFPHIRFVSPVPAGHMYLRSYYAHGTGFDSRYLGYFKLSQVMGLAYPLWTQVPINPNCPNAPHWIVMGRSLFTGHHFYFDQGPFFCAKPEALRTTAAVP